MGPVRSDRGKPLISRLANPETRSATSLRRHVATLAAREEGEDPAELADRVNRTTSEALSALEAYPGVTAKTLDYRTEPRCGRGEDRPVIGRSAVQTLELRTGDLAAGTSELTVRVHGTVELERPGP